jgi:glutathione reductase (NADPH)
VGAADVVDWIRRMEGKGIRSENTRVDWPELIRFKRSFTDPVPDSVEASFAKAGIARFHGRAQFVSHNAVQVAGERLEARFLVIGTGARPPGSTSRVRSF